MGKGDYLRTAAFADAVKRRTQLARYYHGVAEVDVPEMPVPTDDPELFDAWQRELRSVRITLNTLAHRARAETATNAEAVKRARGGNIIDLVTISRTPWRYSAFGGNGDPPLIEVRSVAALRALHKERCDMSFIILVGKAKVVRYLMRNKEARR